MPEVGFEPTHPKITELKSAALDQLGHPGCVLLIITKCNVITYYILLLINAIISNKRLSRTGIEPVSAG